MSDLFSDAWMKQLQERWNTTAEITEPLSAANFTARIAYGFKGDDKAIGMLVI